MSFYFNDTPDSKGNHEVHTDSCAYLPDKLNRTYLGTYHDCHIAITQAKNNYPSKKFDGCYFCCKACHNV